MNRIDVGGKLLTNYMRDLLSHRYFDMQSNTYIVNEIKESMCYMSTDFMRGKEFFFLWCIDINEDIKKKTQYYVLPDYISILKGYASVFFSLLFSILEWYAITGTIICSECSSTFSLWH